MSELVQAYPIFEDLPFSLIKEKKLLILKTNACRKPSKTKAYSRGIILHKPLAPARNHIATSSLIFVTSMGKVIEWFRKNTCITFLPYIQETNSASEAMAFLDGPILCGSIRSIHHSFTECMWVATLLVQRHGDEMKLLK
jgi:hypothetical protein